MAGIAEVTDGTDIQLFLNATTRAQLDRLARPKGYTLIALIEELAASAERANGKTFKAYYGDAATA